MSFICKIAGHSWQNGRCRRCGKIHEAHQWEQIPGKREYVCSVCGLEKECCHQWTPVGGACEEKCALCGEDRENHRWFSQGCLRVCSRCGKTEGSHQWKKIVHRHAKPHPDTYTDGCKCTECGATNSYGEHLFQQVQENGVYIIKCSVCGLVKNDQAILSTEEYDANADEGIFYGGVRGSR